LFLGLSLLWWVGLGVLVAMYNKADLHLLLNAHHTPLADIFFKYITEIGGSVPFIVGGILFLFKYSHGVLIIASQLFAGLVVQVLKRIFDVPRPKLFFAEHFPAVSLPFVEGVNVHSVHSFPSGHTVSIFALFFCLSLITKQRYWQWFYFLVAMLVGFSRIYLSQHFAEDVLAGSIVGVVFAFIYALFHQNLKTPWLQRKIINL
jgi:membrane-associated phospholipid phosphatase